MVNKCVFLFLELIVKWPLIISRSLTVLCEGTRIGMVPHIVWGDTVVCLVKS